MPDDRRASFAGLFCVVGSIAACVAAALMAGGCSVGMYDKALPSPSAQPPMTPRAVPPGVPSFEEAIGLVSESKYAEAEIKFRQSLVWFQAAGDKNRSAECMFWIGFCHEKQGRADEARVQYDKVIRDYPGTPAASMAAQRMGRLPAK